MSRDTVVFFDIKMPWCFIWKKISGNSDMRLWNKICLNTRFARTLRSFFFWWKYRHYSILNEHIKTLTATTELHECGACCLFYWFDEFWKVNFHQNTGKVWWWLCQFASNNVFLTFLVALSNIPLFITMFRKCTYLCAELLGKVWKLWYASALITD